MTSETTSSSLSPAPWEHIHQRLGLRAPEFDDRPLGAYLELHTLERPEAPALQYINRTFTYCELNRRVNQLADALDGLGVAKGDVIGIHLPNMPEYNITLGAISKLGCIGTGVSPLLAPAELAYQLKDAGVSVLITLDDLSPAVAAAALPDQLSIIIQTSATASLTGEVKQRDVIGARQTHDFNGLLEQSSDQFAQRETHWNDTFMIQYTGGTTGRPKGAMMSIRNMMHNSAMANGFHPMVVGEEIYASAFPMFHTAGLAISLSSARYAALMLLIPNPRDIEFYCRQMQQFPPTRTSGVPSLYAMVLNHPASAEIDFSRLKTAACGAAPLAGEDRKKIEAMIGKDKLTDAFGMTETSPVHVSNPPELKRPNCLGIPIPGADTRIVDLETGTREMPRGEPGEIITSGPQVMKGYLNLPEETAHALRTWQGKTWMYTGDVGFMDEEGFISLCDRAKDMLIVGGYKVFSVEVEDKLKSLDFIAQCAIVATPDEKRPGNDIVNLIVELTPAAKDRDTGELETKILEFCREQMSPYKVPKFVHFIDVIPLTPVGKIDKKVLRDRLKQPA